METVRAKINNNSLEISLKGRVDTTNANSVEAAVFEEVEKNPGKNIVLDAAELEYISSAGLRVLMKLRKSVGKSFPVINVSRDVFDIFETTGFVDLFDVRRAMREISVEGCEVIGYGAYGKVYRIDRETIAKIYRPQIGLDLIENEKNSSQRAFLLGVPTAISYDVVKCGESYGVVYELLNTETAAAVIKKYPERTEEIAQRCAALLKDLHSIETGEDDELCDRKGSIYKWIKGISPYLTQEEEKKIKSFVSSIPERRTFLHGDYHLKNILVHEGELLLIDIGDAAYGHPVFDLTSHVTAYVDLPSNPRSNTPENRGRTEGFIGIDLDRAGRYWEAFACAYFGITADLVPQYTKKLLPYAMLMKAYHAYAVAGSDKEKVKAGVDAIIRGEFFPVIEDAELW